MRLLDRYVTSQFLRLFLLFVTSAPLLFVLFDVTDHLDQYLGRGIPPSRVALSYVYMLPEFVLFAFPVAALIATIFTVNGMARHSEVAAAKAGGISFFRLMAPLPVIGVFLTVAAVGLSELVPVTNRLRAIALGTKERMRSVRADFIYRTDEGHAFAIRRLDVESGRIYGLALEREGDEPRVPGLHVVAQEAVHDPVNGWTLQSGYLRTFAGEAKERTFKFASMRPKGFRESPDQLLAEPKDPDEMRYAELGHFIQILQRSGSRPLELMVKQAQKIAVPVATLIIVLLAAPLATTSARGGPAYGIGISLGITIFYLMLFKIAGAAGATGAMPPVVAAWLPNVLFLGAALVLATRVRT